jgi:mevalonate kinase
VPTRQAIAVADQHRACLAADDHQAWVDATTAAAQQAADALATGDVAALAHALSSAGAALEPLGVVDARMRQVLALAVQGGALAAKQTGAGLGGMLLALLPNAAVAPAVRALVAPHVHDTWLIPLTATTTETA